VAAAEVLHERIPSADRPGRPELFEGTHRAESGLQPAVIRFDRVFRIPLGDVAGTGSSSSSARG
jgi:hypothetical protein